MNGDVTVRDVMTREYVGASEADEVVDTVALMLEERAECAIVLHGTEPVGLLTERDVLALLVGNGDPHAATVGEAMTAEPTRIAPDEPVTAAADRMSSRDARRLLVWDDGVQGVLTERDLLAAAAIEPAPEPGPEATAPADDGAYSTQSICEACGSLARDLLDVDGQLLCSDCRAV